MLNSAPEAGRVEGKGRGAGFVVTKRSSPTGFLPFCLLFLQGTYEKENNIHKINQAEDKIQLFLHAFFFTYSAVEHINMGRWLEQMLYKPRDICSQRDVVEKSFEDSKYGKMIEKIKPNKDDEKRNLYRTGVVSRAVRIKKIKF